MATRYKIIDYGDTIEVRHYENGWSKRQNLKAQETKKGLKMSGLLKTKKEKMSDPLYLDAVALFGNDCVKLKGHEERARQSKQRTQRTFKEILKTNISLDGLNSFLTLTYKENMVDRKRALMDLKNFRKKVLRKIGVFEYLGVMERQERGAWHFHIIVFNHGKEFNYEILQELWKHGSINVKFINAKKESNYGRMANYLTSYLSKNDIEQNKKAYFTTKGVKKPIVYTEFKDVWEQLGRLKDIEPLETWNKPNQYLGHTYYKTYRKQTQPKSDE